MDRAEIEGFHSRLAAKGKGAKDWINSWTEVEHLGGGKFAASIGVGHRVFRDKEDGKWKGHKLADERPRGKEYVLIQSAKCCVEVYPYYAKYFDVNHEEVRLHEERWVVQRLFKEPDDWRDVGAYNPRMAVEEHSEPAGDVVKITVTYDTDYGVLTVEYFQRDGSALKHNVAFKNASGATETFRVLQRWAGVAGAKCNGKDFPVDVNEPFLAFHIADKPQKEFAIAENLQGMMFNPDGSEKKEKCLQRPMRIEAHAQGMKTDFLYGNWVLAQNESLTIDPGTATLSDPTEDGYIVFDVTASSYSRGPDTWEIYAGSDGTYETYRGFVEWDVSSIPDAATITNTVFKYNGEANTVDCHIHAIASRPSIQPDNNAGNKVIYDDAGDGTVYADPDGFPVAGTNKQVDLGASADSDLQSQLASNWFAIGIQGDSEADGLSQICTEEHAGGTPATPKPTLYVEYGVPAVGRSPLICDVGPHPRLRTIFHRRLRL